MRRFGAALAISLSVLGCSDGDVANDAPNATVTTTVPASTEGPGGKTNATWAAFRAEDGAWRRLEPVSAGTYLVPVRGDRWAVAFACADPENALVVVHEEPASALALEIELESSCAQAVPDAYTISGALTNASPDVTWLDFGYPLEARGAVLASPAPSPKYEEVNVAAGTWDLAFGLRSDPGAAFSKLALLRGHAMSGDHTLDIDLADGQAFVPESRRLAVHGLDPELETLSLPVYYATNGGKRGIDLGPPNVGLASDVELAYAAVPAAVAQPTDRYRVALAAKIERPENRDHATRGAVATFHDAIDLDLTLIPSVSAPPIALRSEAPYVLVDTRTTTRPSAARYELEVLTRVSNRHRRLWRLVVGASLVSGAEAVLGLPDIVRVEGFGPMWALEPGVERDVTVTVRDAETPLGDGTIQHYSAYTSLYRP